MEKQQKPFYQLDMLISKFDLVKDYHKVQIVLHIMMKENFQRISNELERGQFKMSTSIISKDLGIPPTTVKRVIKECEDLGIIKAIHKSKSKKEPSIYSYVVCSEDLEVQKNGPVDGPVKYDNTNGFNDVGGPVDGLDGGPSQKVPKNGPVDGPVDGPVKYDNTNGFNDVGGPVDGEDLKVQKIGPVDGPDGGPVKYDNTNGFNDVGGPVDGLDGGPYKTENINRKYKKDNIVELRPTIHPFITDVINYLNTKANKNFKTNTVKTVKLIEKRLNEGYTLEQFKQVIDTKVATWQNDTTMNKYLRPETLFGEKFESYLNETPPTTKSTNQWSMEDSM